MNKFKVGDFVKITHPTTENYRVGFVISKEEYFKDRAYLKMKYSSDGVCIKNFKGLKNKFLFKDGFQVQQEPNQFKYCVLHKLGLL